VGQGVSASVVAQALAPLHGPNPKVLQADRHQPEFTLTWAQYKDRVLSEKKLNDGLTAIQQRTDLLGRISGLYGVAQGAIAGIWGLESAYGTRMGTFSVIDALATLAYDGRRASFFRTELLKALHVVEQAGGRSYPYAWQLCRGHGAAAVHAQCLYALRGQLSRRWAGGYLAQ
jgi:membrane-bound lytic murein transglycosylase B